MLVQAGVPELAYDSYSDSRGLNLSVRNNLGRVDSGVWADDYNYNSSASSSMRSLMNMRVGYGHELGNWLLTPYVESDLSGGSLSRWSYGLAADVGFGVLELRHTVRPATGQSDGAQESLLQFRVDFQ